MASEYLFWIYSLIFRSRCFPFLLGGGMSESNKNFQWYLNWVLFIANTNYGGAAGYIAQYEVYGSSA